MGCLKRVGAAAAAAILWASAAATPARPADDLVAKAKALVEAAENGLVAVRDPKKPELELTIDDFVPVKDWVGPKYSAKAPEGKKIYAIACATVAPFCANITKGAVEAAEALGWQATYLDGKGSVQGFVQAFDTAINNKPDAIVTMALPESLVAAYIAKAHKAGIKVVGISAYPEKIAVPDGHYDAYASGREDANALLQAWFVVADSDGKAKITWLWDPGYPFLVKELERQKTIFAECSGCTMGEVAGRELVAAADPVRMQQLGSGVLTRNPDAGYLLTPYGLNAHSLWLAAHSMGREMKIVSKNADPINVSFVAKAQLYEENGASSNWGGWSGIDQVVRLLAGQPPIGASESNLPQHIYVKANAPTNGIFDMRKVIDYKAKYLELWGHKK